MFYYPFLPVELKSSGSPYEPPSGIVRRPFLEASTSSDGRPRSDQSSERSESASAYPGRAAETSRGIGSSQPSHESRIKSEMITRTELPHGLAALVNIKLLCFL